MKYLDKKGLQIFGNGIKDKLHTTPASYVIATGSSNGGYGQKGSTGIAECGKTRSFDSAANSAFGSFYDGTVVYETFPSGLFSDTPTYCDIYITAGDYGTMSVEFGAGLSKTRTQDGTVNRPPNSPLSSTTTFYAHIYAIGPCSV